MNRERNVAVSITDEAYRLRREAEAGPIGKRHTSFELYDLLEGCMKLAARCAKGDSRDEMLRLVAQQPRSGNRRYVERQSDEYTLVCRFVFMNLKSKHAERSNASRYAHCLRQATKRGIHPGGLSAHLRENGGVNALFLGRPVAATTVTTRCLRLARQITLPKDALVRLVVRREANNTYEVLECTPLASN